MADRKILHELKRMLLGVGGGSRRQLAEVETDLVQTNLLLAEAIDKLGSHFLRLHKLVLEQQRTMTAMHDPKHAAHNLPAHVQAAREEIEQQFNAIGTCMQFQDMTNQLIERTHKRVAGLRAAMGELEACSVGLGESDQGSAIVACLQTVNQKVTEQLHYLENGLRQSVRQTHMQSGDIELF